MLSDDVAVLNHGAALVLCSVLLLSPVGAQITSDANDDQLRYQRFSPSIAVIIVILVGALFLMAFFSIYIRHCSEPQAGSVRAGRASTGRSRRAAARGLEASVIDTFPTLEYKVVKGLKIGKGALECAVCLNEFEDDETLRLIPKCDHVFHPECIDEWLGSHTTCPVCRANLVPQPDDPAQEARDFTVQPDDDLEAQNDQACENRDGQHQELDEEPEVMNVNQTLNRNRTRGESRSSRFRMLFPRSHSTGHSLVQPGEDTERFTLRLPVEVRKQVMSRKLSRSSSVLLPRQGSSRRGPRMGESGGNNRLRNFRRLQPLDRDFKSDRWVFSRAPSFLTRMLSIKSPRVAAKAVEEPSVQPTEPVFSKSSSIRPNV